MENGKWLPTRRKKRPYSELFWSVFFRIQTEYGEILSISSYSVRMREKTDQDNSEYEHFLCSAMKSHEYKLAIGKSSEVEITADLCDERRRSLPLFTNFLRERQQTSKLIENNKKETDCKIPQVVEAIEGTQVSIISPDTESKSNYYCRKQIYSMKAITFRCSHRIPCQYA